MYLRALAMLVLTLLFAGCPTIPNIKDYASSGIGIPVSVIQEIVHRPGSYASRIGWEDKTYGLENSNWVYVQPDSKNCFIHWEVNPQGFIVGYKLEGRCR